MILYMCTLCKDGSMELINTSYNTEFSTTVQYCSWMLMPSHLVTDGLHPSTSLSLFPVFPASGNHIPFSVPMSSIFSPYIPHTGDIMLYLSFSV